MITPTKYLYLSSAHHFNLKYEQQLTNQEQTIFLLIPKISNKKLKNF